MECFLVVESLVFDNVLYILSMSMLVLVMISVLILVLILVLMLIGLNSGILCSWVKRPGPRVWIDG